jgi:hypothetical protein
MNTIKLGYPGDSSSVYELIEILRNKGCDSNTIYEFHHRVGSGGNLPHPEFINRSRPFYSAFINSSLVDEWACEDISYGARVDGVWYFAIDTGSNTYLGMGPTSTLDMRRFCFESKIKILYVDRSIEDWISTNSEINSSEEPKRQNSSNDSQVYEEFNVIIKRCGDGISRIVNTAARLTEPNYRDLFLAALHSHTRFIVDVEVINRVGRTDSKVTDRHTSATYIYEFKIYKVVSDAQTGLKQITDQYATTFNRLNGLIFLNRAKKDLSIIMAGIEAEISKTGLTVVGIKSDNNEHQIKVNHKHIRDSNLDCSLTIFLFDLQESQS